MSFLQFFIRDIQYVQQESLDLFNAEILGFQRQIYNFVVSEMNIQNSTKFSLSFQFLVYVKSNYYANRHEVVQHEVLVTLWGI
jgi:hypothetical protein